jgi:hypothetical protein
MHAEPDRLTNGSLIWCDAEQSAVTEDLRFSSGFYVRHRTDSVAGNHKTAVSSNQQPLQGANHGRTHASMAADLPDDSPAARSRESTVPCPTVSFFRGALRKKHRAMEVVLADGMP